METAVKQAGIDTMSIGVDTLTIGVERLGQLTVEGEIPRENGQVVLAHGELSGHAHAIPSPDACLYETPDTKARGVKALKVRAPVSLYHGTPRKDHREPTDPDHATITLPADTHDVVQQAQWERGPAPVTPVSD